jgi:hypothetical protein
MTKRILFYLIGNIIAFSTMAQTSIYHPLPDSNANWNFSYFDVMSASSALYSLTITGDTAIAGHTYRKLYTPFVIASPPGFLLFTSGYKGAIRQDTLLKKVFIIPPADTIEQLLYDFSLQVGDSIQGYLEFNHFHNQVVAIDSILVGGNYRKRWVIGICPYFNLIDGIGSSYGLIGFPHCGGEDNIDLTCFSQNNSTLYPSGASNCNLILNNNNISDNNLLMFYPNPFHSNCTIHLCNDYKDYELRIYDSQGVLVRVEKSIQSSKYTLERGYLSDGIYLLQLIYEKNKYLIKKFILD